MSSICFNTLDVKVQRGSISEQGWEDTDVSIH